MRLLHARRGEGRYQGYDCVVDVACHSSLELSVLEALERFLRYASDREQRDLKDHLNMAGDELRHREHMRSGYRDYYVDPFYGRERPAGAGGGGGGMPYEGRAYGTNGRGNVDEEWLRQQARARQTKWDSQRPPDSAEAERQAKEEANRRLIEEFERIFGKDFAREAAAAAGFRPQRPIHPPGPPDWAVELGVPFPTSRDAIDKAYRALAKKRHPDVGGSQEDMTKLNLAYQKACQAYP